MIVIFPLLTTVRGTLAEKHPLYPVERIIPGSDKSAMKQDWARFLREDPLLDSIVLYLSTNCGSIL
jgi:hypothetical protein